VAMISSLLELIAPTSCVVCNRPGISWCTTCRDLTSVTWNSCEHVTIHVISHASPHIMRLISRWKDKSEKNLTRLFVDLVVEQVDIQHSAMLVAVPTRRSSFRRRGFSPNDALCVELIRRRQFRTCKQLKGAVWVSEPAEQRSRTDKERRLNLERAELSLPSAPVEPVILIDDVATSFATVKRCLIALQAHGYKVSNVIVLCAPRHQVPRFSIPCFQC
jgi:predicted amidophosphoribosyltransferase